MSRAIEARMREAIAAEALRKRTFGDIRSVLSVEHQGYRFVAVDSTLHYGKQWRTFHDFLLDYIKHAFGSGWGQKELAKPLDQRHTVMRWYNHVCELQKDGRKEENGLYSIVRDGLTSAYLLLAYDLYVLRDHGKLQSAVLRRLRQADQFNGARYELFVAATFIRAGFDIDYEDERDATRKHPEFIATHRQSGFVLSVEAKSRQGEIPPQSAADGIRHAVARLLRNAGQKHSVHPLAVFVELNLPPEDSSSAPTWIPHVQQAVSDYVAASAEHAPLSLVMFTNRPHQYGLAGEPDPARHLYALWPTGSVIDVSSINALGNAVRLYGNVPDEFPADFNAPTPAAKG